MTKKASRRLILSLLPTKSDGEIAELAQCSKRTVARLRKETGHSRKREAVDWTKYDKLIGTMTDAELGRQIGRTTAAVFQRRTELGIAAYTVPVNHVDWAKYDELIGTMTDADLANIIGCTPPSVRMRRVRLGKKPFKNIKRYQWAIPTKK